MHVTFFAVQKDREQEIATALAAGINQFPEDTCRIVDPATFPAPDPETDVAVMVGVKGYSRAMLDGHRAAGKHTIYIDKGYLGRGKYYRMSVDAFQPLDYFQAIPHPNDRFQALGVRIAPMRRTGEHIILCGGSLKYALWHRMNGMNGADPMTTWALRSLGRLRKVSTRPVVYRPKPSWKDAVRIPEARYSLPPRSLRNELENAWALVTFGSNAAVEALLAGVPTIIVGDGIAKPLSSISEDGVEAPYIPTDDERYQWACDVAYCQFTIPEMRQGQAWAILREVIHAQG